MYRRRHYFLLFIWLFIFLRGYGQAAGDGSIGEVTAADFHPLSPVIDSNASVVNLLDSGTAELEGYSGGWRVRHTRYHRLLIRNKNGFEAAKIAISYDAALNGEGKLQSLRGYTWNLVDGKPVRTEVDTSEVFLEGVGNERLKVRFTFPDLKEGSVIEYAYSDYSPSIFYFRPWKFQGRYPCLKSFYRMRFPEAFNYVVTKQGFLPISRKDEVRDTTYTVGPYSVRTKALTIQWQLMDVPSFKGEPYISSSSNYAAGLRFQLSEYTELYRQRRVKIGNTWDEVNKSLYKSEAFGGIMTSSSHWLRKEVRTIVDDSVNGLGKARAVYAYVRDHFTNLGRDIVADEDKSLKDIFKSRQGSVAEINLLLTAMLREEGLTADAVILSTRDNGRIIASYPFVEDFNYVVVRLRIGEQTWYLDASEPRTGFGHLPTDCYNGYARVVSEKADSVVLTADSLMDSEVVTMTLFNNDAGDSLVGGYSVQGGYYSSLKVRDAIAEGGMEPYFETERKSYPFAVTLTDMNIDSLKQYDVPVTVHYSVGMSIGGEERIYFNPILREGLRANPFTAAERRYPIEFSYGLDITYLLRMEVPKGYEIEEMPKPQRMTLGDKDGFYEYLLQAQGDVILVRSRLVISRTFFQPEAYGPLKDFYAAMQKKQAEDIVFRKKK